MKKIINIILIAFVSVYAQMELPSEYTAPRDIVSMNSDLDYATAINLLSEYCVQSKGKPIFDPTSQTGTVGVDIENMSWEKALQVMLSRRGLWYTEKANFIEIVPMAAKEEKVRRGLEEIDVQAGYREVLIETIFFEANRRELAETGIDWNTFYDGQVDISAEQLGAMSVTSDQFNLNVRVPGELFGIPIDALLKLFDSNNIGNVLAQPRVVVTEGNPGTVQVGQDFSIKTRDFAGNLTDEFFSVGTILEVTPFVIRDENGRESIVLQTRVERSNATPDAVSTIVNKSEAASIIQMFDGEQTLIAGLYTTEVNSIRKGVPVLRDLPWWVLGLRYLFGYEAKDVTEKELVILLKVIMLPSVYERHGTNFVLNRMTHKPLSEISPYRYSNQQYVINQNDRAQPTSTSMLKTEADDPELFEIEQENSQNNALPERTDSQQALLTENEISKTVELPQEEPAEEIDYFDWGYEPAPKQSSDFEKPENTEKISTNLYLGYVTKKSVNYILIDWQKNITNNQFDGTLGTLYRQIAINDLEKLGQVMIQKTKNNNSVASVIDNKTENIQLGDIVTVRLEN